MNNSSQVITNSNSSTITSLEELFDGIQEDLLDETLLSPEEMLAVTSEADIFFSRGVEQKEGTFYGACRRILDAHTEQDYPHVA